ncbi:MAG: T9SS type A sorting domain-containing protein [Flavobacteriales bacterium]
MKRFSFILCVAGLLLGIESSAQWTLRQAEVSILNGTTTTRFAGNSNQDGVSTLAGRAHGRFSSGDTFRLVNGLVRSTVSSANFCNATVFYRVYSSCATAPSYSSLSLTNNINPTGSPESFNLATNTSINLLNGLTEPGTYIIEFYFSANGHASNTSLCTQQQTDGTSTAPHRGFFEFENIDSFTDGNFSASPAWSGETAIYTYIANSTAAAGSSGFGAVRLNAANAGTYNITTPISADGAAFEWGVWFGRTTNTLSTNSLSSFWIWANESDLESATVDGYRIIMGDDSGGDEIRLERVTNGVGTILLQSAAIGNSLTDFGVNVRVTRDQNNVWRLFTSTLPTATGGGVTNASCVLSSATVQAGTTATDATYDIDGSGFVGILSTCTTGTSRTTAEYDNIIFRSTLARTRVNVDLASATYSEAQGTYTVPVSITNPSTTVATTVNLNRTSGLAASVNNVSSHTLTFPAGSSAVQYSTITISENTACSDDNTVGFTLQNAAGGNAAIVGTLTNHTLNITDNDLITLNLYSTNFNDNSTEGWLMSSTNAWTTDNFLPIEGAYSMRQTSGTSPSYVSRTIGATSLTGFTTTWRVQLATFLFEPTSTTKFLYYLAANESNLNSNTVDGYAIGVNQTSGPNNSADFLCLFRVTNGVPTSIITTTFDWNNSDILGSFIVTRDGNGLWTLEYAQNGDYPDVISAGTVTDVTYTSFDHFGARYQYASGNSGLFEFDDLSIVQTVCPDVYYSQASNVSSASIWATAPIGTGAVITPNAYTKLVVQNGHTVDLNANWTVRDFTVQNGGIFNGGSSTLTVHNDFVNNGTFNANTGTVRFNGSSAQTINGSGTIRFHNLESNNAAGLGFGIPSELTGTLQANNGSINTNNQVTLLSTASGDAGIGKIGPSADVSGTITLQRYIPTGPSYWVYLGSPILNQTIANWNDEIVTTGFPGSDYPAYSFLSFYNYNEAALGGRNDGWVGATNITNPLENGKGYIAYMNASANTIITSGNFNKGTFSVPLSYNDYSPGLGYNDPDGWNLVTNPYPSYIDWEELVANSSGTFDGNYYVYHTQSGNYRVYNGNTHVGTAGRYVPHSQGFFVQATSTGQSLNFSEAVKSATGSSFSRSEEESQLVRIQISQGGMTDEAVLSFVDGATDAFDANFDAAKWESPLASAPEIALVSSENQHLSIDARPTISEGYPIPVHVDMPQAGTYTFTVAEMKNIPFGVCMTIEDVVSGLLYQVKDSLSFTIQTSSAYTGNRMIIRIGAPLSIASSNASCFGANDGIINIITPSSADWNWMISNALGAPVQDGQGSAWIETISADDYIITLDNAADGCEASSIAVSVTQPAEVAVWTSFEVASCNTENNGRIEVNLDNATELTYTISTDNGDVIASASITEPEFSYSELSAGIYAVTVETSCGSSTTMIDLNDPLAIAPVLTISSNNVSFEEGASVQVIAEVDAPNAEVITWTVNTVEAGTGSALATTISEAGSYEIVATASNSSCSATVTATVNATITVGTEEASSEENITLVQTGESVQFQFNGISASQCTVSIYTSTGQLVKEITHSSKQVIELNRTDFAQGVYTFQINTGSEILKSGKLIL